MQWLQQSSLKWILPDIDLRFGKINISDGPLWFSCIHRSWTCIMWIHVYHVLVLRSVVHCIWTAWTCLKTTLMLYIFEWRQCDWNFVHDKALHAVAIHFSFSFIHNSSTSMIPVVLSLHISQLNISLTLQIMKKDQKGPFLRWIMYRFHCRSRRTHKAHTVCHTSPFSAFLKDIFYTKIVPFILFFSICFWPILSYIISVLKYSNVIIKPVTNTREYANILNIGVPSTVLESF